MPRVLVADDSAAMRAFIRASLEQGPLAPLAGAFEIVEATSGFDALRLLPRGPFDLVVADVNMPDINGLELVRFVQGSEHHADVPVLLVSTQSSSRMLARGLSLGARAFLPKPFTAEALRDAVAACLEPESRT